ncbi:hypothetical protein HAX54_049404, partial [Datura stramonium]|nr:hypothetical protein [Datura stramonium]
MTKTIYTKSLKSKFYLNSEGPVVQGWTMFWKEVLSVELSLEFGILPGLVHLLTDGLSFDKMVH